MPFITINNADLYYETFGEERAGAVPVVLIHGSTNTGRTDWEQAAPLLASGGHRVIVPDCRGHGRSANPGHTYSFHQMAEDTAALIRVLGYERAHLVGHSNGGNVALVTLFEYPEVVETAVLQAANAYVSQDLIEREPGVFDPQRVARENPAWMDEMIALHGPTHGPEYWRELLRLTLEETIREPNYTSPDLEKVERPVLAIQGQNDPVNAPSRHAQFIARHIPFAELWTPENVGHNVHREILLAWVERVRDFLARRGDPANDALYRLTLLRGWDGREMIFEVKANLSPGPFPEREGESPHSDKGEGLRTIVLSGKVLTADQANAASDAVVAVGGRSSAVASHLDILLTSSTPWALVKRGVTDLRREPSNRAERVSQALLGEAVRLLEERQGWALVRLEKDGYLGWIHAGALHRCSQREVEAYWSACTHLVKSELAAAYSRPVVSGGAGGAGQEVAKLPFGVSVRVVEWKEGAAAILLTDGTTAWVSDLGLMPLAERHRPDTEGIALALPLFRRFVGTPYLWGGRTPFGFDCSGLSQAFWGFLGVRLPRDADQQFRAGIPVEGSPQPGDLLFFGEAGNAPGGRNITHVAISLGGWEILHANGTSWSTAYNSLDPQSPLYRAWLRENLAGVRRFWA